MSQRKTFVILSLVLSGAVIAHAQETEQPRPAPQPVPAQPQAQVNDCCKLHTPEGCPPVKKCDKQDACVTLRIMPLDDSHPALTYKGTHAFLNIFGAAAARGVENATIRAMNAAKVCPSCDPQGNPTEHCDHASQ